MRNKKSLTTELRSKTYLSRARDRKIRLELDILVSALLGAGSAACIATSVGLVVRGINEGGSAMLAHFAVAVSFLVPPVYFAFMGLRQEELRIMEEIEEKRMEAKNGTDQ